MQPKRRHGRLKNTRQVKQLSKTLLYWDVCIPFAIVSFAQIGRSYVSHPLSRGDRVGLYSLDIRYIVCVFHYNESTKLVV